MRGDPSEETIDAVLHQVEGIIPKSPKEIARTLGVSVRTVQRCLSDLALRGRVACGYVATVPADGVAVRPAAVDQVIAGHGRQVDVVQPAQGSRTASQ